MVKKKITKHFTNYHTVISLSGDPEEKSFLTIVDKGENALYQHFLILRQWVFICLFDFEGHFF